MPANHSLAKEPVSASTRLTPAATPDSDVITNAPISPVRSTCVPPQSSREKTSEELFAAVVAEVVLPIVTTRTCSPYFSPNNAMAPASLASAIAMVCEPTRVFSRISLLTMASMTYSSSWDTGSV